MTGTLQFLGRLFRKGGIGRQRGRVALLVMGEQLECMEFCFGMGQESEER